MISMYPNITVTPISTADALEHGSDYDQLLVVLGEDTINIIGSGRLDQLPLTLLGDWEDGRYPEFGMVKLDEAATAIELISALQSEENDAVAIAGCAATTEGVLQHILRLLERNQITSLQLDCGRSLVEQMENSPVRHVITLDEGSAIALAGDRREYELVALGSTNELVELTIPCEIDTLVYEYPMSLGMLGVDNAVQLAEDSLVLPISKLRPDPLDCDDDQDVPDLLDLLANKPYWVCKDGTVCWH